MYSDRFVPILSQFARCRPARSARRALARLLATALLGICCFAALPARADVVGRLKFTVTNADTDKPIAGAKITIHDPTNVAPDGTLTTGIDGTVTSGQLLNHAWHVTTAADGFQDDTRNVTVIADAITGVDVPMEPLVEKTITIRAARNPVETTRTNDATERTQVFVQNIPSTGANPQSLSKLLHTIPGIVNDSVNQNHPRGEHAATSLDINGIQIGGALQGRGGQILSPENIQTLDAITGGFAPEYGGESSAVLNVSLRSGTLKPIYEFDVLGGGYNTVFGSLTFGGQLGPHYGLPDANGQESRRFGYFVNLSGRRTTNFLEPPQPDNQTAHNTGATLSALGNFDYQAGSRDHVNFVANSTPASFQVANRAGLGPDFAGVGQGYGYGGQRNSDGTIPAPINPGGLGDQTIVMPSADSAGQDVYQRDVNDFGVLTWRHEFNPKLTSLVGVSISHAGINIHNNNPAINLSSLPIDSPIEFNPEVSRNSHDAIIQGSVTQVSGKHNIKLGISDDEQTGSDNYRFTPGSQLALDVLAANDQQFTANHINAHFAPAGTFVTDEGGNPVLDVNGNQVYTLNAGATTSSVDVSKRGWYRAAYVQDTFTGVPRVAVNYGVRFDWYRQVQNLGGPIIDSTFASPRINIAWNTNENILWRFAYDRMIQTPPLAQDTLPGIPVDPERVSLYEVSAEKPLPSSQPMTLKLDYYYKQIRNDADTGILFPFTQIGVYTTNVIPRERIHGLEVSWNMYPRANGIGPTGYLAYAYSIAKPGGQSPYGGPDYDQVQFNDHDQRHTLSWGGDYTWAGGEVVGLDFYYGNGTFSSIVYGDSRTPRMLVNFRAATGSRLLDRRHGLNLALIVENLFDDRSVINFQSAFTGTRFQQGRRISAELSGKF